MKLGVPELVLILVIVLIIFGAGKLPQLFDAVGKGVSKLRKRDGKELDKIAEEEKKEVEKDNPAESTEKPEEKAETKEAE